MAKKKKTQLKPVARGFATVSLPKKVVVTEAEPENDSAAPSNADEQAVPGVASTENPAQAVQLDEFDPEKVEEQSLQNLVDRLQEKTEKEITRTIKAIEVDRRFAMTLPKFELDTAITDKIIALHLEEPPAHKKPLDEPEDKAIARLAITYGVLRRLGFSEDRVLECLNNTQGIDLDEAYDWLFSHCTEDELEDRHAADSSADPRPPQTPRTPRTPSYPKVPTDLLAPTQTKSPLLPPLSPRRQLDANAPKFVPRQAPAELSGSDTPMSSSNEHEDLKNRILASLETSDASDSDLDRADDDHPTVEYARLKMKLDDPTTKMAESQRIRARLDIVKKNLFFDRDKAEEQYRAMLAKPVQRPLRNRKAPKASSKQLLPPAIHVASPVSSNVTVESDVFSSEGAEVEEGGLLQLLEPPPTSETAGGVTFAIRDMALPKHWSGRTSKALLVDTVSKIDRYAAVSFTMVSGSSRARRASVSVRWDSRKADTWSMEDISCRDDTQAEQYIATVALHGLTYPETAGFAGSPSSSNATPTFFRLLPAVFRDLWDELEAARKEKEDSINRRVWSTLRSIIEPKLGSSDKTLVKVDKIVPDRRPPHNRAHHSERSDAFAEQLASSFRAREATTAYQDMLYQRSNLPIASYRAQIIDTLKDHQVLVLSGETGCGKSTQVPTFILEDQLSQGNHCKIFCTEPRRISAISLAQRVSRELGEHPNALGTASSWVGYSIRLESNTSKNTRLTFVTNGIALRMLEGGSGPGGKGMAFDEITHIVIDEVHERTIESDFLLIVLKSLLEQRSDLKVILMSATVDAEKISEFFGGCPTLHVPGRTFPVNIHYLEDAVEYTGWSISENSPYARRGHDKFYNNKNRVDWSEDLVAGDEEDSDPQNETVKLEKRYSADTAATINLFDEKLIPYDLVVALLEKICLHDPNHQSYSAAILVFMPGLAEIRRLNDMLTEHPVFGNSNDFILYPLHSTLSSENQGAVFDIPPEGVRKIVIATNIAETGITIPDITCVIDSGKHREMRFDEKRQISRLVETFIARSNAAQRRGRAGRVQEGLCFHLFTKYRHDVQLVDHPLPEMMRLSLSDLALRIKIMKVKLGSTIEDVLSRALDPPIAINVQRAISSLIEVRALTTTEEITPMGRLLSKLPTDVHLGKFLLIATIFRCLDPALTIAAALNSKSPFVSPFGLEQEADRAKLSFRTDNSDFLTIHNAFASWRRVSTNQPSSVVRKFCRTNYLSQQNLQQIEELRQQFLGYLTDSGFIQVDKAFIRDLSRLRYGRNKTRFTTVPPELDCNSNNTTLLNAALAAGLFPKLLHIDGAGQMHTIINNQLASFHPSSVNFRQKPRDLGAHHLAYFTLMQSRKLYAWETGPVDDLAIILLCGEAETRLISNTLFIDRKIKYRVPPKTNIAMKHLRTQLASLFAQQYRGKVLLESQVLWNDMAIMTLGRMKLEEGAEPQLVIPE